MIVYAKFYSLLTKCEASCISIGRTLGAYEKVRESCIIKASERLSFFKESYLPVVICSVVKCQSGTYPHILDEVPMNIYQASYLVSICLNLLFILDSSVLCEEVKYQSTTNVI